MDFSESGFWQHVLIVVLILPYFVGICVSAIYTNTRWKHRLVPRQEQSPPAREVVTESASGRIIATCGATLLAFLFSATSVAACIWAVAWALGLPNVILVVLLALGLFPVLWATVWTAGRAWHVESLLGAGKDVDQPMYRIGEYLPRSLFRRSVPRS